MRGGGGKGGGVGEPTDGSGGPGGEDVEEVGGVEVGEASAHERPRRWVGNWPDGRQMRSRQRHRSAAAGGGRAVQLFDGWVEGTAGGPVGGQAGGLLGCWALRVTE